MAVPNRLLEELPSSSFKSVHAECEPVELEMGDVLAEPREHIRDVYFPTGSIISLVARVAVNRTLEVALVGNEGMVGLPLLLGAITSPLQVLVQGSGEAWRMKGGTFARMIDTNRPLRRASITLPACDSRSWHKTPCASAPIRLRHVWGEGS
jgi:hypothetical protein